MADATPHLQVADAAVDHKRNWSEKEQAKKKRKQQKTKQSEDGNWERCMFRLERKKRFCNMERIKGTLFCGVHLPADCQVTSKNAMRLKSRERVPCPVDPAHSVFKCDLDKHVLICNKTKEHQELVSLPYYSENINSGKHASQQGVDPPSDEAIKQSLNSDEESASTDQDQKPHGTLTAQQNARLLEKLKSMDFAAFERRIHEAFEKHVPSIPLEKLSHASCDQLYALKAKQGASASCLRHIKQQASIIGHLDKCNLVKEDQVYLEMGAGRAMLSLALAQQLTRSSFVLVDRAPTRGKADHLIKQHDEGHANNNQLVRAKIDIRHLNLAGMDPIVNKPVVCMSKHLCGVATDLSLRAVAQTIPPVGTGRVSEHLCGIAIALCCHHACCWEDYVNPEFFLDQGFTQEEFELITNLSSWATSGMATEGNAVEQALNINKSQRVALGRECKRLLDTGRVQYLQSLQLNTRLVHYCELDESLENCLLLAWR